MARSLPRSVDTVVVGNGPSALILSYILHGNIPTYDPANPHPDPFLHRKVQGSRDLLDLDADFLTEHFCASDFSYSTQALPINVLLDTLIRPLGETDDSEDRTCVTWRYDSKRLVSHVVLGDAPRAGGQWVDNPVEASWEIGTLSYAGMLSLPGYSFREYHQDAFGTPLSSYLRPTRREVAKYFAAYPSQVGIEDAIYYRQRLWGITRGKDGFHIASHNIRCRHLVLASGIFSELIQPPPLLQPLLSFPYPSGEYSSDPLLVIGSGFSAADVIISAAPAQKIIHIFKWAPATSPSPLRACHQQAYPEYAGVYRKMKLAALAGSTIKNGRPPSARRASSTPFDLERDWNSVYEGLPNTAVIDVKIDGRIATVTLQGSGAPLQRQISGLAYVVGRRGSLTYLDEDLRREVLPEHENVASISGQSLRGKANDDLEVAKNIFIIGSLTGDSLIRFAYGGCLFAAGRIMRSKETVAQVAGCGVESCSSKSSSPYVRAMNGFDGHNQSPVLIGLENLSFDSPKSHIV